jgi:hypothetical protein
MSWSLSLSWSPLRNLIRFEELDPIEELGVKEVDDDDSLVDDDSLTIEEFGERVAVIVMEEGPSREELLPRTSELTLDVLAPNSLDNDDDVGMTEVLPMPLDADGDDEGTLADCELLSVEDRDDALLKHRNWLDDVVSWIDVLRLELEENIKLEEPTWLEDEGELL